MTLDLAPDEAQFLKSLHAALQQAQRDFTVAFTAAMYARRIPHATFVTFEGDTVQVAVPEDA